MKVILFTLFCVLSLAGCGEPKDKVLPTQLESMEALVGFLEKLTPEEQELTKAYAMRHTSPAKDGGKAITIIPEGTTVGIAIEDQRKFKANAEMEATKKRLQEEKLRHEAELAIKKLNEAVTVTLSNKKLLKVKEQGKTIEKIEVAFSYKNNLDKDISLVKGVISIKDMQDKVFSTFPVAITIPIKTAEVMTLSGSRPIGIDPNNDDAQFAKMENTNFSVNWDPSEITLSDGTILTAISIH
jgi:hypothetical protein